MPAVCAWVRQCSPRRPCRACDTPKPAIPFRSPNLRREQAAAKRRRTDEEVIRAFGSIGVGEGIPHDFRVSSRWLSKVVPVSRMTPSQLRAELGRIARAL